MPLDNWTIPPRLFAPEFAVEQQCLRHRVEDDAGHLPPSINLYLYYGNRLPDDWACGLESSYGMSLPTRSLDLKRQYAVEYFFGAQLARMDYLDAFFPARGLAVPGDQDLAKVQDPLLHRQPSMAYVGIKGQHGNILDNMLVNDGPTSDRSLPKGQPSGVVDLHLTTSPFLSDFQLSPLLSPATTTKLDHLSLCRATSSSEGAGPPERRPSFGSELSLNLGHDYVLRLGTGGRRPNSLSLDPIHRYSLSPSASNGESRSSFSFSTPRSSPIPRLNLPCILEASSVKDEDGHLFGDATCNSRYTASPQAACRRDGESASIARALVPSRSRHQLWDPEFPLLRSARAVYMEMLRALEHWDKVMMVHVLVSAKFDEQSNSRHDRSDLNPSSTTEHSQALPIVIQTALQEMNHLEDYQTYQKAWSTDTNAMINLRDFIHQQLSTQTTDLDKISMRRFNNRHWPMLWCRWNAFCQARRALLVAQMRLLHMIVNYSVRRRFSATFGGQQHMMTDVGRNRQSPSLRLDAYRDLRPDYNNYLSGFVKYYDQRPPEELPLQAFRFTNSQVATTHQSQAQKWVVQQLQLQVRLQMQHQFGGISGGKIGECRAGWSTGEWRRANRKAIEFRSQLQQAQPPAPTSPTTEAFPRKIHDRHSVLVIPSSKSTSLLTTCWTNQLPASSNTLRVSNIPPMAPAIPAPPITPFTPRAIQVSTTAARMSLPPGRSSTDAPEELLQPMVKNLPGCGDRIEQVHVYSPCGSCVGEERELYCHREAGIWYSYRQHHWRRPK